MFLPRWKIVPQPSSVGQVAHPVSIRWSPRDAVTALVEATTQIPSTVGVLITGGGFIQLSYPQVSFGDRELRQTAFLSKLHAWTLSELTATAELAKSSRCDLVIGVDVNLNGRGVGQFVAWFGSAGTGLALVPKRFPVGDEARFLAGVDARQPFPYPRVVTTQAGSALLLVCHDAQAYNHRNRANVARAKQITARSRAMQELHEARKSPGLVWALNAIHSIDRKASTRTFRTSYKQLRSDFPGDVSVAAGIGYGDDVSYNDVLAILDLLVDPPGTQLTKVVISTPRPFITLFRRLA
jgi:hypothetical protein